jgi:D-sedoheptulose 7-phosphate isomerase
MVFEEYLRSTRDNLLKLESQEFNAAFSDAGKILLKALNEGGSILVCGNGGSNADAQHFAGELVNYFTRKHKALPVIALGTNNAVASAWSNDHSYEDQFAREVEAYGSKISVLLGITTSGKSKNVNFAFKKAHELGMKTIALTSSRAREYLYSDLDVILDVPVEETHKIQECHIVVYHALCILIENGLDDDFLQ